MKWSHYKKPHLNCSFVFFVPPNAKVESTRWIILFGWVGESMPWIRPCCSANSGWWRSIRFHMVLATPKLDITRLYQSTMLFHCPIFEGGPSSIVPLLLYTPTGQKNPIHFSLQKKHTKRLGKKSWQLPLFSAALLASFYLELGTNICPLFKRHLWVDDFSFRPS